MGNEKESLVTRWSLVRKIASPGCDEDTWTCFYDMYRRLIYGVARKAGLSHDEADDVVQETMASLPERLKSFETNPERGSFRSWLLQIARWRIGDVLRDRPAVVPSLRSCDEDNRRTATEEQRPDPASVDLDSLWEEQWKISLYEEATARVRQQVSPDQFQMFDFYVVREMPVLRVARSLGVSVGSVYLARHRILKLIRQEIARLKTQIT